MGRTKSGTTIATPKRSGNSRRTARATPPESIALATIEPSTQAATLSGCPSIRAASSRMRGGFQSQTQQLIRDHHARRQRGGARSQAFADRNIVVDLQFDRAAASRCTSRATASAVCQIRLSSARWRSRRRRGRRRGFAALSPAGSGTRDRCPAPARARRNPGRDWRSRPAHAHPPRSMSVRPFTSTFWPSRQER